MAPIGRVVRTLLGVAALAAGVTFAALEGGDVAVLRTKEGAHRWRETRVWWAEGDGGALWLEAATPDRAWLLDVRGDGAVELVRDGVTSRWYAAPVEGDEPRQLVRALLREKYGWADAWVGLVRDTSQSIAVRLAPR